MVERGRCKTGQVATSTACRHEGGVCKESAAVMPLTTRSGEQVGGIARDALPEVLLIFGPDGF